MLITRTSDMYNYVIFPWVVPLTASLSIISYLNLSLMWVQVAVDTANFSNVPSKNLRFRATTFVVVIAALYFGSLFGMRTTMFYGVGGFVNVFFACVVRANVSLDKVLPSIAYLPPHTHTYTHDAPAPPHVSSGRPVYCCICTRIE